MLKGIAVSPGIVIGKAFVIPPRKNDIPAIRITAKKAGEEINRFRNAVEIAKQQIQQLKTKLGEEISETHSHIFDAHLLFLEDKVWLKEVEKIVRRDKLKVEGALCRVLQKYDREFANLDVSFFQERVSDLHDVVNRILNILMGKDQSAAALQNLEEDVIVVAHDISPSDTALMHQGHVIGFITEVGSRTSHTAIMARALEIPAVVGVEGISLRVNPHQKQSHHLP